MHEGLFVLAAFDEVILGLVGIEDGADHEDLVGGESLVEVFVHGEVGVWFWGM